MRYKLVITVHEIRGYCPVYRVGDRITIVMPNLVLEESDKVCIHALTAIQTILQAMARGYSAEELGVGPSPNEAYLQCPDPGPPYTSGGTVIFKINRIPVQMDDKDG